MDLKIKDVSELLKVSESTIRRWLSEGKIPGYKLHRQYRFSRYEIENWMIRCRLKPAPQEEVFVEEVPELFLDEATGIKSGTQHFLFYRSLHQGNVLSDIQGETKEEVIRHTTDVISEQLRVDREVLAELLLDRELLMPTALNRGVAVPHTRDFLGKRSLDRLFIVYPQQPLSYGALDGLPVHTLFFLFASADKSHLCLLAKIAHFCSCSENVEFLKKKPSKQAFLERVRSNEAVAV